MNFEFGKKNDGSFFLHRWHQNTAHALHTKLNSLKQPTKSKYNLEHSLANHVDCIAPFFQCFGYWQLFNTLVLCFRLGLSTVQKIIMDTCDTIWDALAPTYLPEPKKEDWKNIAAGFYQRWNFPNCLGALDGKHIVVQAPAKSGSLCFNY